MTLIALMWLVCSEAHADDIAEPEPAGSASLDELGPPGTPPPADQVDAVAHSIASGIKCPVCQGLSIAESPSPTARQMYDRVKELVAMGYSREQIEAYYVSRYGEWVLLAPTNPVVWLAPALVAGVGLAFVARTAMAWRKEPEKLPSDDGELPKDEYERRLLEEIDK